MTATTPLRPHLADPVLRRRQRVQEPPKDGLGAGGTP